MCKRGLIFFVLMVCGLSAFSLSRPDAPKKVYLWRGVKGMEVNVRDTVLHVRLAERASGLRAASLTGASVPAGAAAAGTSLPRPAVIVCPGGSYHHLDMNDEGLTSAAWFNSIGVDAFVLQYRVAYNGHHYPDMLEDIQMAILYVRSHADEWGIDKTKIGAIGYSAGGHLVTMAGVYGLRDTLTPLGIEVTESLRPDYVMPIYPVVTMQEDIGHRWSRKSLLGKHRNDQKWRDEFSMELNVPSDMPPVFLLACEDDPIVIYENSVRLDAALTKAGISHEFHSHPKGGHGFGMRTDSYLMKESRWNEEEVLPWLKGIWCSQ